MSFNLPTDDDEAPSPPAGPWAKVREPLLLAWQGLNPQQRILATAGAGVLAVLLLWLLLVGPALSVVNKAPAQLDALDVQLAHLNTLAAEAQELKGVNPVSSAQAAEGLQAACARLGDKARLTLQGDRATVNFTEIDAVQLRAWLEEVRSTARARPVEAQLTRSGAGHTGTLVLALGGSTP